MPLSKRLGAVVCVTLSFIVAPSAPAGERAIKPISFKSEMSDGASAINRYAPRLVDRPATAVNAALSLTQPATNSADLASSQSETKVLEAVLASSQDRSSAALVKDCTLTAPMPGNTFARDLVAAR